MAESHAVLVVDDDTSALKATVRTLEKAGYLVFRTASGGGALRKVRAHRPSLVLLDMMLPDISGTEVLRRIRVDPALEAVSVVLFGAHAITPEQQALALDGGADGYIVRPVADEELLARVRAHLRQRTRIEGYRTSEARVRTVVEHQVDAVLVVDVLGVITYANPAAGALFGRDPGDLIGAPFGFPVIGQDVDVQLLDIPRRDRPTAMAEMRVTPIEWEGRSAWIATLRDITARRTAERAVRESKALLDMATNVARLGAWSIDAVTGETVWSESTREILDVPPDAMMPLPGMLDLVVPEHNAAARRLFETCLRDGTPFDFEAEVTTMKGRRIHVRSLGAAVREDGNRIARVQGAFQDITGMKLAEQRIARSERRFREMTEAMPMIVWTATPDGTVDYINRQFFEYTGISSKDAPADCWRQAVPPRDLRRAAPPWTQALVSGDAFETEFRLRRGHDRSYRWHLVRAVAIRDEAGAIVRWYGTGMDVHVSRLLQEEARHLNGRLMLARDEAERASRAKSRFLAGMSHELRTPLSGILGYAQLLQLEGGLNAAQSARVHAMLDAGTHLLEMINSVLDLSQIEADRLELHASAVDPRTIARACLDLVRPAADAKGLALRLLEAPHVPHHIMADPIRLREVLLNLLGNAVKFTAHGSVEVRLLTTSDTARLRLEVADTGPGIPPERRLHLFQEFERLGADAAGLGEGAGLGLALSARLAVLMGGSLGHQDNPCRGSVFWLELPLTETTGRVIAGGTTDRPPLPARSLRLMVVDDVAMNRDIASAFLHAAGYEVVCAENGLQAVTAAAAGDFDAVLMDVRMPGIDGLEAARRIRALAGKRGQVPIIALTAQAFAEQVEACRRAGMESHLAKPYTHQALLDAVARVVMTGKACGGPSPAVPGAAERGEVGHVFITCSDAQ